MTQAAVAAPRNGCNALSDMDAIYGISAELLQQLTGAHQTTARRWKRTRRVPAWLARLVRVVLVGELGEISPAWAGWRVVGGNLVSPEGWSFRPGEIRALPLMHAQIANYQARERLPSQADWIGGRLEPLPGALVQDAAPRPRAAVVRLRGAP